MKTNQQAPTGATTHRTTTIVAGACYLITHVISVGAVILYNPILKDSRFIIGSGPTTQVLLWKCLQ